MLVHIIHTDSLNTYRLPKEVEGTTFIQDYDEYLNLKNLISVKADNGKWFIKSDNYIKILNNNQIIDSCELQLYNFYLLKTITNKPILLFPTLAYNDEYIVKEMVNEDTITFGKDKASDVVLLQTENIGMKQFELTYKSGKWFLKNTNPTIPVYCNSTKVNEGIVENLDTIFVMGYKVLIFGKLLFISNERKNVYSTSQKLADKTELQYTIPTIDTSNQAFNDFYSPEEYFSKSPVLVKKTKTLELDIANPIPKEKPMDDSFIMNMVPTILMSGTSVLTAFFTIKDYKNGTGSADTIFTTVIMLVVMVFISIIWPIVQNFAEKIRRSVRNTTNAVRYKRYLKDIEETFKKAAADQKMDLVFNNLSLKECEEAIKKSNSYLFSINYDQNRFLNVRIGVGKVKLDADIRFSMSNGYEVKEKLQVLAEDTIKKYEYIEDAPYSFSFKNSIAFINAERDFSKYYESIILQLLTFHDYHNLKIVVLTTPDSKLNLIRNINHCWSEDKSTRYFATNAQEAEIISGQLIRILNQRKETGPQNDKEAYKPHYLIITDDIYRYRNTTIINKVMENTKYLGFSALVFASKISDVPNGCSYFLQYDNEESTLFESEMSDDSISKFKPEFMTDDIDFAGVINRVSNIPVSDSSDISNNSNLPDKYGFLEMLNVGNVDQLNSVQRWKTSTVINSLATPLGVDTSGSVLKLDLHEKAHGPHGLIAGMTGSGKSETIVSYILSLAVNYSPNEVQFVLIDYKGGGLAGAFENRKTGIKLPHLVGTITNLDKSSMNRTLVSIKSELQRRQRVFNEAKEVLDIATIDIYKYQELVRNGSIEDPMAHLFIICDEFAELKAQQPDFMDELVSAARIGRSLGIHLILATQKPSGVVDEQIWSNSKFKICAKVQTTDDSNEMIRKPDAAYIKESGRFFLQVGYDEIFVKAQSAYTGVKYVPHESTMGNSGGTNSITFIDNLGNSLKTIKKEEKKLDAESKTDLGDELGCVTKYLIECSKKIGYTNKQLWLDNIPGDIYLYDLINKYQYKERKGIINPLIGEYDDPSNQKQGPVSINISEKGNLWICGMTGSGKTTLLSTIIYSSIISHSSTELNIFVVDLLTDSLRMFAKAPQVADVISSSEHDRITKVFYFLKNEVERRKKILALKGQPFSTLVEKGEQPFPTLLVCINGYDILYDSYYEILDEVFSPLARDSSRVGINFVLTSTTDLLSKLQANFTQRIALRFAEYDKYLMAFDKTEGIVPIETPGRGLIMLDNLYEFQVAQLFREEEFDKNLSYIIDRLDSLFPKAKGIPSMPKVVSYENVKNEMVSLDSVPIGFETISNCVKFYDFNNLVNLVLYTDPTHGQCFEVGLIKVLKNLQNSKIVWLDSLNAEEEIENVKRYSSSFGNLAKSLHKSILEKKSTDPKSEKIIFVIGGYHTIEKYLEKAKAEDENIKTIDDLIVSSIGSENYKFIILDTIAIKSIDDRPWIDYYDYDRGILLATDPDEQEILDIDSNVMTNNTDTKFTRDIATAINQGIATTIKYIRK